MRCGRAWWCRRRAAGESYPAAATSTGLRPTPWPTWPGRARFTRTTSGYGPRKRAGGWEWSAKRAPLPPPRSFTHSLRFAKRGDDHRNVVVPAALVRQGDQPLARRLRRVVFRQHRRNLAVVEQIGQAVGAEDQPVARLDRR